MSSCFPPLLDATIDSIQRFIQRINTSKQESTTHLVHLYKNDYELMLDTVQQLVNAIQDPSLQGQLKSDYYEMKKLNEFNQVKPAKRQIIEIVGVLEKTYSTLQKVSQNRECVKSSLPQVYNELSYSLNSMLNLQDAPVDSQATLQDSGWTVLTVKSLAEPNLKLEKQHKFKKWTRALFKFGDNETIQLKYKKPQHIFSKKLVEKKTKVYSIKLAQLEPCFLVPDPFTVQLKLLNGLILLLKFENEMEKTSFVRSL